MTRRRPLWVGVVLLVLLVLLAVAVGFLWFITSQYGPLTADDAAKVRPGMSLAEVEELFGRKGHCTGQSYDGSAWYAWRARDGGIAVDFKNDRAVGARFLEYAAIGSLGEPPTPLERLRAWLPW